MSNINFTIDFTGTPDPGDVEAAKFAVDRENVNRETPLPTTPGSALKTSYLTVLGEHITVEHANNQKAAASEQITREQALARWALATPAQRTAALAELPPLP